MVVPAVGIVGEPIRDTAAPRVAAPITAAENAARARRRALRIRLRIAAVAAFPVLTPLTHVTAHVVQSQLVRLLRAYRVSIATAVGCIPSHVTYAVARAVLVSSALASSAGRVLPLRLRRQAERFSRQLVQLRNEFAGSRSSKLPLPAVCSP